MSVTTYTDGHGNKFWRLGGLLHRDGDRPAIETAAGDKRWWKYGRHYPRKQLIKYYSRLAQFGRYCLKRIRLNKLKRVRWIHGELLCHPSNGNYLGGQDYHAMSNYFNKL